MKLAYRYAWLRSILSLPGESLEEKMRSWQCLFDFFLEWPESEEKQSALVYVESHLEDWEDEIRSVTNIRKWWPAYPRGAPNSVVRLIRAIRIHNWTSEDDPPLRPLLRSPVLQTLTHLNLSGNHLCSTEMEILVNSPHIKRLKTLILDDNLIGNPGLYALARSPYLQQLQTLSLSNNTIRNKGMMALAQSPFLRRLRHLDLSGNMVGSKGLVALSNSRSLRKLHTLLIHSNLIGNKGIVALAQSPIAKTIRELILFDNFVTWEAEQVCVQSPFLRHAEIQFESPLQELDWAVGV